MDELTDELTTRALAYHIVSKPFDKSNYPQSDEGPVELFGIKRDHSMENGRRHSGESRLNTMHVARNLHHMSVLAWGGFTTR